MIFTYVSFYQILLGEYDLMDLSEIEKSTEQIFVSHDSYLPNLKSEVESPNTSPKGKRRSQMKASFLHEFGYSVLFFFLQEIGGRSFVMIVIYSARVDWTTIYFIAIGSL